MMEQILTLFANYIFPIAACIALFFYMSEKDKTHKDEIEKITASHKDELKILDERQTATLTGLNQTIADNTKAINQMTVVITQLSERIVK